MFTHTMPCDTGVFRLTARVTLFKSNSYNIFLYDDMSQYLPKTVLYYCKQTVLKVLRY